MLYSMVHCILTSSFYSVVDNNITASYQSVLGAVTCGNIAASPLSSQAQNTYTSSQQQSWHNDFSLHRWPFSIFLFLSAIGIRFPSRGKNPIVDLILSTTCPRILGHFDIDCFGFFGKCWIQISNIS